jgi:hypothetical protein
LAKTKFELLIAQNAAVSTTNTDESKLNINEDLTPKLENIDSIEPVIDTNDVNISINLNQSHLFIEEAIKELLKARKILRCSYVYGYYLETFGHKKFIFEFIQTEFEESTENLSQIIARPHLKTPKPKIVKLTNILRKKRLEFLDTITRGLNNFNDTPPALKKYSRQRWKYLLKDNIQNDDEFKNTIALSLKELNPKNPWIIDKKGRHTNLLALLNDWPELEQELDSILVPSKDKKVLCAKWDCGNVRAVNSLSGSLCNYCSIKCMRSDRNAYLEEKQESKSIVKKRINEELDCIQQSEPNIVASTSRSSNIYDSLVKRSSFMLNKNNKHSSSLGSNTSINEKNMKKPISYNNKIDYEYDIDINPDIDLQNAIEVSKLQYFVE